MHNYTHNVAGVYSRIHDPDLLIIVIMLDKYNTNIFCYQYWHIIECHVLTFKIH